jgi:single-strand DNA-binding protein
MEVSTVSLNRVTIIGYLGQDPELRLLPVSGQPVANFSVATDEFFTDKEGNRTSAWIGTISWSTAAPRKPARNT